MLGKATMATRRDATRHDGDGNREVPCQFGKCHDNKKFRGDEYNFEPKIPNFDELHFYPNVQLPRNYNRNNTLLKSEGQITTLKNTFIQERLSSYEYECTKLNCYSCSNV